MIKPLLAAQISNQSGFLADEELIAGLLDSAYSAKRKKPACLDLLILDDKEIQALNRRHLRRDEPTDVLSFDDGDDEDGRLRLGDIAISAETAEREAAARGLTYQHELAFYALHGLYHLMGMRDDDDQDRAKMLRAQAKAMRDFGLPAPDSIDSLDGIGYNDTE